MRFDLPATNDGDRGPLSVAPAPRPYAGAPGPWHSPDLRLLVQGLVRAGALWCLMAIPAVALLVDIQWLGNSVGEHSLVESIQLLLLAVTAAAFLTLARGNPGERRFAVLAAGFFICMAIRETDAAWDLVFDGLWQILVAAVALAAVAYAAADWRAALRAMARFVSSRSGVLMILALGILLVHSRLLGMSLIWEGLLDEQYLRVFKNAVEETTELLAYVLISTSGIAYLARHLKFKRPRQGLRLLSARNELEST
ncbi:hypothetical protein ACW7G2_10165 [Luteimonas sp. A277]